MIAVIAQRRDGNVALAGSGAGRQQWHLIRRVSPPLMTTTSNTSAALSSPEGSTPAHLRWRRELALAGICIGFGLLIVPTLIYGVGVQMLGAYGGGPHLGSFYGDYFRNLSSGSVRTWFLVLAPYLLLVGGRLIFWRGSKRDPNNRLDSDEALAQPPPVKERREPFVAP